jgi:peptidoglycan/xylan/chitin deacetylase (PgdA/CDA1 family)
LRVAAGEPDFPPLYSTCMGSEGLKLIVVKLKGEKCNATFFVCAELIDSNPELVDILKGFEIGCHGFRHVDLAKLTEFQANAEIAEAVEVFEEHKVKAYGFRAPYCSVNYNVLNAVRTHFEYDSSMPFYSFGRMPGIKEVPVYTGGKMLGISPTLFDVVRSLPVKNKVFFTHPWEYGGFDFNKIAERRRSLKAFGYSKDNYAKNLDAILEDKTCSVKELL